MTAFSSLGNCLITNAKYIKNKFCFEECLELKDVILKNFVKYGYNCENGENGLNR